MTTTAGLGLRADAVIFDVDDTLVDFDGAARRALLDAVHPRLTGVSDEQILAVWVGLHQVQYDRFLSGELDFDEMRTARMAAVLAELDPAGEHDASVIEQDRNEAIFGHYALFEDARQCLRRMHESGLAVGMITNSDGDYQRRKLTAVGLADYAEAAVCSGDVGVAKPDPAIFRLGCEQVGVQPGRAIYVGDRWSADVLGALAAGLGAVWLNRTAAPRPDGGTELLLGRQFAEISALTELSVTLG